MIHSFLYVANTDGIIRFPYRNGELKARAPAETTGAKLSGGAALLRSGGHWKRDILFSPNGKKMYVSIGSRSNDSDNSAEADGARISSLILTAAGKRYFRRISRLVEPNKTHRLQKSCASRLITPPANRAASTKISLPASLRPKAMYEAAPPSGSRSRKKATSFSAKTAPTRSGG